MRQRLTKKWRPPLSLVLGGSLAAVLVLPVFGVILATLLAPVLGDRWAIALVVLGSGLATIVLGYLLWRLILSPVRALGVRARDIREGSPVSAIPRAGTPEIGEVADVVLDMAATLRARELAVRAYADHVTHELRSPLAAIRGAAELLDGADAEEVDALARTIREAEGRAERLLNAAAEVVGARSAIHQGQSSLSDIKSVDFEIDVTFEGSDASLPIAASGLAIVFEHLAGNAIEAGATHIRVTATAESEGARLEFADDGAGVDSGNADKLFDPFFTTRREDGGTGMGLAIVQTLLLAHGAEIAHVPTETGATFVIRF